jgi:prefoldin subunit 5
MNSKILGRAAKFGWRTPYLAEKRRARNMETLQWKAEALEEIAEEKEEALDKLARRTS